MDKATKTAITEQYGADYNQSAASAAAMQAEAIIAGHYAQATGGLDHFGYTGPTDTGLVAWIGERTVDLAAMDLDASLFTCIVKELREGVVQARYAELLG